MASAPRIIAERVEYLDENGKLVTEALRDFTKKALKKRFASLDDFLKRWKAAERKQAIIEELEAEGLPLDPIAEELGKDLDPFDLICHVAFDKKPLTRRERAENVKKRDVFTKYGPQARAVLDALLDKYRRRGRAQSRRRQRAAGSRPSPRWARRATHQGVRRHGGLRAGRPRAARRPLSGDRISHVVRTTVKSIQDIMRQDVGVDGDAQRISQLCWMFFLKIIDDQDQELELLKDGYRSPIPKKLPVARPGRRIRRASPATSCSTSSTMSCSRRSRTSPTSAKPGDRRRVVRDVFEDAYNYMKSGQLMRQVVNKINEVDFNNLAERQHFGDIYEQILNDLQAPATRANTTRRAPSPPSWPTASTRKPGEILLDPACGTGGFLTCAIRHMRERYVKTPEDEREDAGRACARWRRSSFRTCSASPTCCCTASRTRASCATTTRWRGPTSATRKSDRVDIVLTNPPFGGREEDGIESNFPKHFRTRETADLFLALIVRLLKPGGRAAVVLPDGTLFGEGVKTRLKEHLMEECNLHTIVRLPNSVFKPYASIGTNLLFFEKGEPTKDIWFYEHRVPEGQKAYSMTKPIRFEHLQGCIDWWGGAKRKGREETPQAWKVTAEEVKARGYNLDIKNPHAVADDHGDPETLLASLDAAEAETAGLRDQLKAILAEALAR